MRRDVHPAARGTLARHKGALRGATSREAVRGPVSGMETGIGMFAGSVAPQNLSATVMLGLVDQLTGDPGIRLAGSRGRRRWFGGSLSPQRFSNPQGGPSSAPVLAPLPLARNQRRSLNGFRGTPTTPAVNAPPTA